MVNSPNMFHGNTAIMYHAYMYRYTTITKLVKLISAVTVVLNFTQNNIYVLVSYATQHVNRLHWWTHRTFMYVYNLHTSPEHVQHTTSESTAPQAGGFVDSHYLDLHTLQCRNTQYKLLLFLHAKTQPQIWLALWTVTTLICTHCSVQIHTHKYSANCSCTYTLKHSHKPDWLPSYFTHDVPFTSQVLIAQTQEIVDYKSWNKQ
jgi:hypothetical protein